MFLAGVIAVAVFGLYGAATSQFDISAKLEESGAFEDFWNSFAFVANGIVFFYAGASSVNFVIRSDLLPCNIPSPFIAAAALVSYHGTKVGGIPSNIGRHSPTWRIW